MLDYLPDIASDLSRFHRIDDANSLEAPVFFALVQRLPAYGGLLSIRMRQHAEQEPARQPARPQADPTPPPRQEAAPVTPALLRELNAKLGVGTFSFAAVGPDA